MERIVIGRLTGEGTAALIAGVMGDVEDEVDFAALVHRRTGGNPFFTHQVYVPL